MRLYSWRMHTYMRAQRLSLDINITDIMKRLLTAMMALVVALVMATGVEAQQCGPRKAVSVEAQKWYKAGKWRQGWRVKPYAEMDVQTFWEQYEKHPQMYDSIFTWLRSIDPVSMKPAKGVMTWSHATAICQDLDLRTPENLQWEQHRKTIDLQWVVTGSERMAMTHDQAILTPKNEYNPTKDVQNFKFGKAPNSEQYTLIDTDPKHFVLFFPNDVHECCGIAETPGCVRKIVVKIEYFE